MYTSGILKNINAWTNTCCSVQQDIRTKQTFVIPSGSYIKSDAFCFLMKKELASSD